MIITSMINSPRRTSGLRNVCIPLSVMNSPNLFLFSGMVYDDAEVLYAEVKKDGDKLLEDAFKVLFPHSVPIPASPAFAAPSTWQPALSFTRDTQKVLAAEGELVAYNTTFLPRRDVVRLPISHLGEPDTLRRRCVQMGKGGEGYALFEAGEGAGVAGVSGMFADCMPASGQYEHVYGKPENILIWVSSIHERRRPLCPP
jgi:hypothetical protein